ncbi:FAD/NAD(P)-binding domain-containing protein [Aulographum hederae CBS 113979]|uniref:FAD/NAD(P)-binding domain-containing protein n=1 Tax=Aulographum hederae CBS 113979 TaxID=1176131 RepID=A0A6G1HB36_9PEZI|nr:FAD/NAD(P)-binding domain-containing protein [Aulographum hederae CBS 113979]
MTIPYPSNPHAVIIIGAGIGGLATALSLHAAGITDIHIFEASRTLTPLGVGINIQPHAVLILRDLGLLPALDATGIRTKDLRYYNRHGNLVVHEPRGIDAGYAIPQFSIHRGELQMMLLDAVKERLGPDRVHLDHALESLSQTPETVSAKFIARSTSLPASIPSATAACLVAADGINSTVRSLFYPSEGPPRFSGRILWRGVCERPPFLTGASMLWAGHADQKFIAYPISAASTKKEPEMSLVNWIAELRVRDEEDADLTPPPADWTKTVQRESFLPRFAGWKFPGLDVEELVEATEKVFEYPMCDRSPVDKWTFGRVTLLGDAAHAMFPIGSNGASQAILDAENLAEHLSRTYKPFSFPAASVAAALLAYEMERLPVTREIVLANRRGGPDAVLQVAETRAPGGFERVEEVKGGIVGVTEVKGEKTVKEKEVIDAEIQVRDFAKGKSTAV